MTIFNGDCLEILPTLDDNSVDLIFCDLPYGQTACDWDNKIDINKLWEQFIRVKKERTPLFFTTTTKFGVELIESAPKKCEFRYDLVWVKSAPCGFLNARKMPMRKHEMIYVFYEKLPVYNYLDHHKRITTNENKLCRSRDPNSTYGKLKAEKTSKYEPPLPNSIIKGTETENEVEVDAGTINENNLYSKKKLYRNKAGLYKPPLPNSIIKEKENKDINKEVEKIESVYYFKERMKSGKLTKSDVKGYEPPLPDSMLEIKSTKGKHPTEKPVELLEWIIKYYTNKGDVVLDPTMGSGTTGVACKNLEREFIGIEKEPEIYKVAVDRIKNLK